MSVWELACIWTRARGQHLLPVSVVRHLREELPLQLGE